MPVISISYLQSSGFYEFMLPFLLITAITYGILEDIKAKSKTFPLSNTPIAIISVVIGLFATNSRALREILFKWTPFLIIILILLFLFLIVQKLHERDNKDYIAVLIFLILILATMSAYGMENLSRIIGGDAENLLWGIGFLIFVLIVWGTHKMSAGEST